MTKSGTHDSDPFNLVEVAMREFHGFIPIAIYYFSPDVRNIQIMILFSNQQWTID